MTTLKAHFDGKVIVLDEPAPVGLVADTPVTVVVGSNGTSHIAEGDSLFEDLSRLARPLGLPPDFAAQHDHYTKGLPKR